MPPRARQLALVTCDEYPQGPPDEGLLPQLLEARGWTVTHTSWDQADASWKDFGGVVVRSTWDYTRRTDDFLRWIDDLERSSVPLWNPAPLLRWNHDKRYLEDLEERGIAVVPTGWIEQGGLVHLHEIMAFEGWDEAVVKPVISAGAVDTFRVDLDEARARDREFRDLVRERPMMVQQLMPEIRESGELSFCFFDGTYSHAVRKLPKDGEFRVQERLGGTNQLADPAPGLIRQAEKVLDAIDGEWLYARVDAVVRGRNLILMELELLEPSMYCDLAEGSAERFADAIDRRLQA